jgi:hypothetical protein
MKTGYSITIGGWSVKSEDDPRTELVRLEVVRNLGGAGDHCEMELYAPPAAKGGLLDQAVGAATDAAMGAVGLGGDAPAKPAYSVDVRGTAIAHGDGIVIELSAAGRGGKVMTAEVDAISSSLETICIRGVTGVRKLATTRTNLSFENRTLGQVAGDLCGAAQVDKGSVAAGSSYPFLAVDERRSLLQHLRDLCRREGLDLYFDEENRLAIQAHSKTGPDHQLRYGAELLSLEIAGTEAGAGKVRVYGEGPSSNRGSDTWHWLVKDLSPFRGEAGGGARTAGRADAALKTKDAANLMAKSLVGGWQDGSKIGRARLLGNPALNLGQAIEIKGAPRPELNGLFKVIGLRHLYDKRAGFTTTVTFSGQGGGGAGGSDLLGAAVGALGL